MRCLVTGAAGFIGSHLAERLLAEGHEVCGIDGFIDYYPRWIKERNLSHLYCWKHFTFVEGDLLQLNLLPLLDGIDWIFHQAAQAGVRSSWGHEFPRYMDCNIVTTQRLLEVAVKVKTLQRFIYASSSSVYGDAQILPVSEDIVPHPLSPYGVSKLAAEHLCQVYYENFGLPSVSLRYFTVYGPRQRPDMAFHRFCKAIIDHQPVFIFGDGQQVRDFTYISDVVMANMLAATKDEAIGTVLNVAGGVPVTLDGILSLLQDISGSHITVSRVLQQPGDAHHTWANTMQAERLLGYHPLVSLQEGLAAQFQDMLSLYHQASVA